MAIINSNHKILITYESHFGSTGEVAHFIGKELSENGNIVEIRKITEVDDVTTFDSIVIGSAIQYDNWMPRVRKFVKENQKVLRKMHVAFFFTCLVLSRNTEKAKQKSMVYSNKITNLVPQIIPVSVGRFAGVLELKKMSFLFRLILRGLFAVIGVKERDYRDWNIIRSWAKEIHFQISNMENNN